MNYVRHMINSNKLADIFDLPVSLRNRMVEVTISPTTISGEKTNTSKPKKSSYGCLVEYADKSLIPRENGAWERAVAKKYANS